MATAATAEDPLNVLQIEKYYPQKFGYAEAIRVRRRTKDDHEYGIMIIRKLLEMDHKALYTATTKINNNIKSRRENESQKSTVKDEVIAMKNLNIFAFLDDEPDMNVPKVHPMDLMMAVVSCCDNFLRQMLVEKMFMCRIAIPILLPSYRNGTQTMLLWGLNTIFLENKGTTEKKFSQPLVDIPNPIVSFFRVGKLHRSKSKLLNMILNEPEHHTFYHRDCLNGAASRLKSNGIIEAAWFISDGKFDSNSEFFTVLNLRGDALEQTKQTRFMCEQSSLLVIMVDTLDSFKTFHDSAVSEKFDFTRTRIILAFVSTGSLAIADWKQYIVSCVLFKHIDGVVSDRTMQGREMNQDEWKTSIRNSVRAFMEKTDKGERLLRSVIADSGFVCDCDGESWRKAKKRADELLDLVKEEAFKRPETSWCPLQGKPWVRLGELEKKQRRRISKEDGNRQDIIADISAEIKKCREEQVENIRQLTRPIHQFCDSVMELKDISRQCFLKLTKINLDIISREKIPALNEKQPPQTSIGLEHIIREMGQMFEAAQTHLNNLNSGELIHKRAILCFPEIVATLFLEGIPLEIMDGDASNVPLTWLKAVLAEIEKQIGKDKKVFVLSIIGVQSSGKSTFLNALFGLQFPVSAGRCTKGIYCHLVPVHAATFFLRCDYILIIDSEGLRAPEYAGKSTIRDNELAALAIGLADLAIVNMKGESFSDMEDILQIVVHALIRIRQTKKDLKLMPSCFFVHQNVPAADAAEKTETGKKSQFRFLDEMARKAAQNEDANDVNGFGDVIEHDENLHSWYMPDLWTGRPPMATVNINYSDGVSEVKEGILKMIVEKQLSLSISNFYWRISDLWNALLHNNFVLCFRNTLEILAHRDVETKITDIFCEMKNYIWQKQTVYNNKVKSCENILCLSKLKIDIKKELEKMLDDCIEKARYKLDDILREGEYKNFLEMSRAHYEQGFQKNTADERSRCLEETFRVIDINLMKLKNCTGVHDLKIKLFRIVKAEKQNTRPTILCDGKAKEIFNQIFDKETVELKTQNKQSLDNGTNFVKTTIEKAIQHILSQGLLCNNQSSKETIQASENIKFQQIIKKFEKDLFQEMPCVAEEDIEKEALHESSAKAVHQKSYKTEANKICREVFNHVKSLIDEQSIHDVYYNKTFVNDIIFEIGKFFKIRVTDYDSYDTGKSVKGDRRTFSATTPGYKFKKQYVEKFLFFIGSYLFDRLSCMTEEIISKTDPFIDIKKRYKPLLEMVFYNISSAEILANMLVNMAKETVNKDLGRMILEKINSSEDKIFESKHSFFQKLLTDLAKAGKFPEYRKYLQNSETYVENKIITLLEQMFIGHKRNLSCTTSLLSEIITNSLKGHLEEIKSSLKIAEEKCKYDGEEEFLSTFQELLHSKHCFQKDDYKLISDLEIGQLQRFVKIVLETIEVLQTEAAQSYQKSRNIWNELKSSEVNLVKELFDKIIGCREKCPFCSAPCMSTRSGHYPASCHRAYHCPIGVSGTVDVRSIWGKINEVRSVINTWWSTKLVLKTCDTLVDSKKEFRTPSTIERYSSWYHWVLNWNYHPYNKYKEIYPEWEIKLDRTMDVSKYWKWFIVKFRNELELHYYAKCLDLDIESNWYDITLEEALDSLKIPV